MSAVQEFEKIKNPIVAAFVGFIAGAGLTWTVANSLHEGEIKIYEATRKDIERRSVEKDELIKAQQSELASYVQRLGAVGAERDKYAADSRGKSVTALRQHLSSIDKEISDKRRELARTGDVNAGSSVPGFALIPSEDSEEGKKEEKSALYMSREKELQDLVSLRALINQRLAEALAR